MSHLYAFFSLTSLLTTFGRSIYEALSNQLYRMWEYFVAYQIKASEELLPPLSSAPCSPAPGRRIIIIRCDNQMSPANLFVSFDRVVPPAPPEPAVPPRKNNDNTSSTTETSSSDLQPPAKRKWSIFKAMFGVSSNSKSSDSQSSSSCSDETETQISDTTLSTDKCLDGHPQRSQSGSNDILRPRASPQLFSFKFSLEWLDRPHWPTRNRRLFPPSLPAGSQIHLQQLRKPKVNKSEYETASENPPPAEGEAGGEEGNEAENGDDAEKPTTDERAQASTPTPTTPLREPGPYQVPKAAAYDKLVASKYVGRALAEWSLVVGECDGFFARRRDEGVPNDRLVETPTLGVENFKK